MKSTSANQDRKNERFERNHELPSWLRGSILGDGFWPVKQVLKIRFHTTGGRRPLDMDFILTYYLD